MSNEIVVPDYLKSMMADGDVKDDTARMQTSGGAVPRITTRGKIFRKKEGDDEEKIGTGMEIDVVILGMNPENGLAHTYYKDGYSPDANSPPDCSSQNGVTPDSWIGNPVNDVCASCNNQKWGSAVSMSGGKAKACRDSRHLHVAIAEEFKEDPKNCTLYILQVTVNSLKDFTAFGKELARKGLPGPQFVLTRISMDEEASVPMLHFSILGVLGEEKGKAAHERNMAKEWDSTPQTMIGSDRNNKRALPEPEGASNEPSIEAQPVINSGEEQSKNVDDLIDNW